MTFWTLGLQCIKNANWEWLRIRLKMVLWFFWVNIILCTYHSWRPHSKLLQQMLHRKKNVFKLNISWRNKLQFIKEPDRLHCMFYSTELNDIKLIFCMLIHITRSHFNWWKVLEKCLHTSYGCTTIEASSR